MALSVGLIKQPSRLISLLFVLVIFLLPSCGKNEGTGGALGAAGGGLIGNAVAGKNSKVAGTLIGGLLGGLVGGTIGRAADEEEAVDNELKQRERIARRREIQCLAEENERLRKKLVKWCANCGCRSEIVGANTCARCGDELIYEKFCRDCKTVFSPQSGYKFCPYCKDHVRLCCR